MNFSKLLLSVGALTVGLTMSATSAQAFSFTTNIVGTPGAKDDIMLESVTVEGRKINNFSLVKNVDILYNDSYRGFDTGAASADRGDNASGVQREEATNENMSEVMSNRNLNNIVDTEDRGRFKMNMAFEQAVSKIFVWERGMNSTLGLQAIDQNGNLIGNFLKLTNSKFQYAGYSIDTTEIGAAQRVGSVGVSLADLGVSGPIYGVQVINEDGYNGADFKLLGGVAAAEATPEPTTMAGMALAGAGLAAARRRKAAKQAAKNA